YWQSSHSALSNLKMLNTLSVNLLCKKTTDGKIYNAKDIRFSNDVDLAEDSAANNNIRPKYLVKKENEQFQKELIEDKGIQQRNEQANPRNSRSWDSSITRWQGILDWYPPALRDDIVD